MDACLHRSAMQIPGRNAERCGDAPYSEGLPVYPMSSISTTFRPSMASSAAKPMRWP